jgi:putative membrane protein
MKPIFAATLVLLATTACNRTATDGTADTSTGMGANTAMAIDAPEAMPVAAPGDAGTTTDPATYVRMAAAGDMFEIESARAIIAKTKNADVRAFANMMIDEHTKSTAKIKEAASAQGVMVPAAVMMADQDRMLDDIKSADAATADRTYLANQRTAHSAALALHQGFAQVPNAGQLGKAAAEIAPVVQRHLTELDRLEGAVVAGK